MGNQAAQGLLSPFLQRARISAARPHLRGKVLDIGCGNGALAALVPAERYFGHDRDAAIIALASSSYPQHTFSGELPRQRLFDTVIALAVIEHMKQPAETLREWASYLADGGQLVLTTPHKAFDWVHDLGAKVGIFSHDAAEEHEVLFDRPALASIAGKAGLKLIVYKRFLGGVNQLCVLAR